MPVGSGINMPQNGRLAKRQMTTIPTWNRPPAHTVEGEGKKQLPTFGCEDIYHGSYFRAWRPGGGLNCKQ